MWLRGQNIYTQISGGNKHSLVQSCSCVLFPRFFPGPVSHLDYWLNVCSLPHSALVTRSTHSEVISQSSSSLGVFCEPPRRGSGSAHTPFLISIVVSSTFCWNEQLMYLPPPLVHSILKGLCCVSFVFITWHHLAWILAQSTCSLNGCWTETVPRWIRHSLCHRVASWLSGETDV